MHSQSTVNGFVVAHRSWDGQQWVCPYGHTLPVTAGEQIVCFGSREDSRGYQETDYRFRGRCPECDATE